MTSLLLITAGFPYGNSEPFLEYELPYLSRFFDHITIVPVNQKIKTSQRILPPNVKTVDYSKPLKFSYRLLYRSATNISLLTELLNLLRNSPLKYLWLNIKILLKAQITATDFANWLNELCKDINGNIIIYSYWLDEYALALAKLKKKLESGKLKVLSRAHGWDIYLERHPGKYLPFRKLLLSELDSIYVVSEHGKQYLRNKFHYQAQNLKVSYLGVTGYGKVIPDANEFKILSCSSLIPLKRVHLIIEALSLIKNHDVSWYHVGGGSLLYNLQNYAMQLLQNKPNIRYRFYGPVPNNELPTIYRNQQFSIFINVSEFEGLPVSIMEAMSYGIPVIATNVGGTMEIVNHDNGFLLPKDVIPSQISNAITLFFQLSNEKKAGLSQNAYTTWSEKFNAEINLTKFVQDIKLLT